MEDRKPTQSDDIDLGTLFNKIGQGIQNGWMGFLRFLALIRRTPFENKMSFIAIILASVIIGGLYTVFLKKKYYETSMVLSSDHFNKRLVDSMIEKLNLLAQEEKKAGIAKVLNLSDTLADNILGFTAEPFVDEDDIIELEVLKEQLRTAQLNSKNEVVLQQVIQRIEIENRHAFRITVRTLNPSVIPNLQDAIVQYFRNNPYIRKRIEITKTALELRMTKLTSEITKLDSIKSALYKNYLTMAAQNRQGSNNVILSDKAGNPVEIFKEDLTLYNELEFVRRDLYLQRDFEIVDGFTEFSEPSGASATVVIIYSLLIGIIVAYVDVSLRSFNTYLSKLDK